MEQSRIEVSPKIPKAKEEVFPRTREYKEKRIENLLERREQVIRLIYQLEKFLDGVDFKKLQGEIKTFRDIELAARLVSQDMRKISESLKEGEDGKQLADSQLKSFDQLSSKIVEQYIGYFQPVQYERLRMAEDLCKKFNLKLPLSPEQHSSLVVQSVIGENPAGRVNVEIQGAFGVIWCERNKDYMALVKFLTQEKDEEKLEDLLRNSQGLHMGISHYLEIPLLLINEENNDNKKSIYLHERAHFIHNEILRIFRDFEPGPRDVWSHLGIKQKIKDEALAWMRVQAFPIAVIEYESLFDFLPEEKKQEIITGIKSVQEQLNKIKDVMSEEDRVMLVYQLIDVDLERFPIWVEHWVRLYKRKNQNRIIQKQLANIEGSEYIYLDQIKDFLELIKSLPDAQLRQKYQKESKNLVREWLKRYVTIEARDLMHFAALEADVAQHLPAWKSKFIDLYPLYYESLRKVFEERLDSLKDIKDISNSEELKKLKGFNAFLREMEEEKISIDFIKNSPDIIENKLKDVFLRLYGFNPDIIKDMFADIIYRLERLGYPPGLHEKLKSYRDGK